MQVVSKTTSHIRGEKKKHMQLFLSQLLSSAGRATQRENSHERFNNWSTSEALPDATWPQTCSLRIKKKKKQYTELLQP